VRDGFAAARSPGRLELFGGDPPVLLDGAHNPAGARSLAAALRTEPAFAGFDRRIVVLGVLEDKDVEGVLESLLPVTDHLVATSPPYGHAVPAERLTKLARAAGLPTTALPDAAEALEHARALAADDDLVLVTGSLYLVGAARTLLGADPA
jgi:dihydrofolate synthase / folylpolyglutamate synthase